MGVLIAFRLQSEFGQALEAAAKSAKNEAVLIAFRLQSEFGQAELEAAKAAKNEAGLNRLSASVRIWTITTHKHIGDSIILAGLNRLSASVRIWTDELTAAIADLFGALS